MNYNDGINCISTVKCEPKTRRLSSTTYDRPEVTLTDTLQTNEKMREKLLNYTRVDDIEDVSINTHVRYVTLKDGSQRFCLGGLLKKRHSKYVILSNGTFSWSVQRYHYEEGEEDPIFETAFFRILSKEEQQRKVIEKQQEEIEQLRNTIRKSNQPLAYGGNR